MLERLSRQFSRVALRTIVAVSFFAWAPSVMAENDAIDMMKNGSARKQANLKYSNAQSQAPSRTGEVYLLRGFANIFSLGMDEIEDRLHGEGIEANTFNHSSWKIVADDIIERSQRKQVSYPIVIAGHSLGANSSVSMANYLAENGVKVALVVAYDPTLERTVGKDVRKVINYHFPNGRNDFEKGPGFRGTLRNVDVSDRADLGHMNVEKDPKLQENFVSEVLKITRKRRR